MRPLLIRGPDATPETHGADVNLLELYLAADRPVPSDRPWLALSMITTLDGATAADGRSGPLGGPADWEAFMAMRAVPDVILVGAGTVRAERYKPVRLSDEAVRARQAAGHHREVPRIAIVTARLDLDLTSELFTTSPRPIVLTTTDADQTKVDEVAAVAEVRVHGTGAVDLPTALSDLRATYGAELVVCEGGPSLNSALATADYIDEICMTIAPLVAGGPSPRVAHSPQHLEQRFRLASLLEAEGELLGRWIRSR